MTIAELSQAYESGIGGATLIADAREPLAYRLGHLPNAISLFWEPFSDKRTSELLPPERIAAELGARGASPKDRIVLYDDGSGGYAGKMLWVLDRVGHPALSLLNGGLTAWRRQDGEVARRRIERTPTSYTPVSVRENVATKDWILANMAREDVVLLDARSEAEYQGRKREAKRRGHIPGAVHFEWERTIAFDAPRVPRYLTEAELRPLLDAHGIVPEKEIVCYCQRGTRSAQVYSVLRLLGYSRLRNYLGSWAEWGNDPNTPIATPP